MTEHDRTEAAAVHVAICIATCRRPEGLRKLLGGIDRQRFTKEQEPVVRAVVVENGVPAGAREVCESMRPSWSWRAEYESETRLGIPFARNRALHSAGAWADFIVFIDDDEVPEPQWLDELLHVQRTYDADVVDGLLVRRFDGTAPEWIRRGRFFVPPVRPTGAPRPTATTGNTLVRREVMDAVGEFDERFALSGGSDTHYFQRVIARGFRVVWAADALVYEDVPAGRATVGWYLRRAYRVGNCWSLCERDLFPAPLPGRAAKYTRKLLRALAALVPALVRGQSSAIRGMRRVCETAGNLTGLFGVRYQEYAPTGWMMRQRETSAGGRVPASLGARAANASTQP